MSLLNRITPILDGGWTGEYGELANAVGSHPRAVGSAVRAYAKRHPGWPHEHVFSKRTGRPAYEKPTP